MESIKSYMRENFKIMIKILAGNFFLKYIISIIGVAYTFLVFYTSSLKLQDRKIINELFKNNENFIYAFWHDQLLMCPFSWMNKSRIFVLISNHRDGDIISKLISFLGFKSIRGSTSKPKKNKNNNSLSAARKIIKSLNNGNSIGIAPDGPRGPRHIVSEGIIQIAKISGKKIIPVSLGFKSKWTINTWDKFIVPRIFNTINIHWGNPIIIKDMGNERYQEILTAELNKLTKASNYFEAKNKI